MGQAATLVMWPRPPINFRSLHMKFGFDWPSGFWRKYLKMVDDDWRTTELVYTVAHLWA